ncbi:MAG: hypothetical protein ACR2QK_25280 [Acidimicrobiales bacterium]
MEGSGEDDPTAGPIAVSYVLTADDLGALSRASASPLAWWTSGALVVVLVLGALTTIGRQGWFAALLVALLVVVLWYGPRKRRAVIRFYGESAETVTVTAALSATALTLDAGWTSSSIRLDRFSGYSINRRAVVLSVKEKPAVLLPVEKVSDEFVEALVARLASAGIAPVPDDLSAVQRAIKISLVLVVLVFALLAYGSLDDEPLWPPNPVPATGQ